MIIGITGTLAAGKGTIVDYLKEKGFKHYSMSGYITEEIIKREMPVNRDSMVEIGNDLRSEHGPSYIAEQLYKKAFDYGGDAIIESLRTTAEIEALKNKDEFYLFSIDANPDIRYFRAIERRSEKDSIDFQTFLDNERREMENDDPSKQNISKCMQKADYSFTNNRSINELYMEIDKVLDKINSKDKNLGRKDYLSWDEYFMGIAMLSGKRSKDPSTQVGACIVDQKKRIVGTGYNGAPRGIHDKDFPWSREGSFLETKYAFVCHAELNAILNSTKESLDGCTLYVALFPCNECAKAIVQSGIKKVVYLSDKYKDVDAFKAGRMILEMAGIELFELKPITKILEIELR